MRLGPQNQRMQRGHRRPAQPPTEALPDERRPAPGWSGFRGPALSRIESRNGDGTKVLCMRCARPLGLQQPARNGPTRSAATRAALSLVAATRATLRLFALAQRAQHGLTQPHRGDGRLRYKPACASRLGGIRCAGTFSSPPTCPSGKRSATQCTARAVLPRSWP